MLCSVDWALSIFSIALRRSKASNCQSVMTSAEVGSTELERGGTPSRVISWCLKIEKIGSSSFPARPWVLEPDKGRLSRTTPPHWGSMKALDDEGEPVKPQMS